MLDLTFDLSLVIQNVSFEYARHIIGSLAIEMFVKELLQLLLYRITLWQGVWTPEPLGTRTKFLRTGEYNSSFTAPLEKTDKANYSYSTPPCYLSSLDTASPKPSPLQRLIIRFKTV
jgi:hypothetical protein